MNKLNLNEIAYSIVKNEMKIQEFDFDDLCNRIIEQTGLTKKEFDSQIGDFYTNLLQDIRFLCLGNNKWTLKEYLTLNDYKLKLKTLYDFDDVVIDESEENNMVTQEIPIEKDEIVIDDNYDDGIGYNYDHEEDEEIIGMDGFHDESMDNNKDDEYEESDYQ